MPKLTVKEIKNLGCEIVKENSDGIRFADIVKQIAEHSPETNVSTIGVQVGKLARVFPKSIEKPSRGLYRPIENTVEAHDSLVEIQQDSATVKEEDFYEPFTDYLANDLDECSTAVAIGSMRGNGKWGNPDVVGINKSAPHHVIKFEPEIISAEIKTNPNDTVTAFGQAVAYRLFSHKTYLVLPDTVTRAESDKILLLCSLYGIGLVYFSLDRDVPEFSDKLLAQKFVPDMFSLNDFVENIRRSNRDKYNKLFG